MTHNWKDLKARLPAPARARAGQKTEVMLAALTLRNLLQARGITQQGLAEQLDRGQGNLSRTLRRSDMHVSTVREVVEAMGGSLEIAARFPDRDYRIDQFPAEG